MRDHRSIEKIIKWFPHELSYASFWRANGPDHHKSLISVTFSISGDYRPSFTLQMWALTTSMSYIRKSIAPVAATSPFGSQSRYPLSSTVRLRSTSISARKCPGSGLCGIRFRERAYGRDKALGTSFDKRGSRRQTCGNDSCGGLNHAPCLRIGKSPSYVVHVENEYKSKAVDACKDDTSLTNISLINSCGRICWQIGERAPGK